MSRCKVRCTEAAPNGNPPALPAAANRLHSRHSPPGSSGLVRHPARKRSARDPSFKASGPCTSCSVLPPWSVPRPWDRAAAPQVSTRSAGHATSPRVRDARRHSLAIGRPQEPPGPDAVCALTPPWEPSFLLFLSNHLKSSQTRWPPLGSLTVRTDMSSPALPSVQNVRGAGRWPRRASSGERSGRLGSAPSCISLRLAFPSSNLGYPLLVLFPLGVW